LELHPVLEDKVIFNRYSSEPIGCVIIPVHLFLRDPVRLNEVQSDNLQSLVKRNHCMIMLRWDAPLPLFPVAECVEYLRASFEADMAWPVYGIRKGYLYETMQPLHFN